jgi:hypothetical protein
MAFAALNMKDSIVRNSVAQASGGAIFSFHGDISLANVTFSNNLVPGKNFDVLIKEDDDSENFLRCDPFSKVNFCNGLDGLVFVSKPGNIETNCHVDAISDPSARTCATGAL